jgi:hypothetical protein
MSQFDHLNRMITLLAIKRKMINSLNKILSLGQSFIIFILLGHGRHIESWQEKMFEM